MTNKTFLRRDTAQYLRLGKKRKKVRKWQRPKGRDNKMRLGFKGYPKTVSIGYRSNNEVRGSVDGIFPTIIASISDMKNLKSGDKILLGRFGTKKKLEIIKLAKEKNIKILNLNTDKFVKLNKNKMEKKK